MPKTNIERQKNHSNCSQCYKFKRMKNWKLGGFFLLTKNIRGKWEFGSLIFYEESHSTRFKICQHDSLSLNFVLLSQYGLPIVLFYKHI